MAMIFRRVVLQRRLRFQSLLTQRKLNSAGAVSRNSFPRCLCETGSRRHLRVGREYRGFIEYAALKRRPCF